jgi:hypothetical protein
MPVSVFFLLYDYLHVPVSAWELSGLKMDTGERWKGKVWCLPALLNFLVIMCAREYPVVI